MKCTPVPDIPAVHCEARKVSYRQTKDGLVVSFVIHPNDMPDALAVAPLGTRYMLALAAIGDDELPVEPPSLPPAERPGVETGSSPTARARASDRGKERYRTESPMEQARDRAAMLPTDERFQAWVAQQRWRGRDGDLASGHSCVLHIREHCCNGGSRSLIAEDPEAYRKFLALETMFKIAVGEIAEPR